MLTRNAWPVMGQVEISKFGLLKTFCSVLPLVRMRQVQGLSSVSHFPFWVLRTYWYMISPWRDSSLPRIPVTETELLGAAGLTGISPPTGKVVINVRIRDRCLSVLQNRQTLLIMGNWGLCFCKIQSPQAACLEVVHFYIDYFWLNAFTKLTSMGVIICSRKSVGVKIFQKVGLG